MDESTQRSRHPDSMRRALLWALLPTLVLFLIAPSVSDAQVTTSITSTTGAGDLGTSVTQAGNLYDIGGGTRPGNGPNLFHSFGDFSVGGGDIANFLNDTQLPTSNILGRVTGGNISNIYGTIQTTDFGNANLFLVNPSGIVFGPNASLDVGGSVSFSTASQYLRLSDEVNSANFYANPANDFLANSVLVVDPLPNFGFLSSAAYGFLAAPDPSAITVQGSALSVPSDQSISLIGGNVVIEGATLPDLTVQQAHLSAPNGRILLGSAASPGEFDVTTLALLPNVEGQSFTSVGSVSLEAGSSIDVSGAGTVFIIGGQLVLSVKDANLSTSNGLAPSDAIFLHPGGKIVSSTSGTEPGPDIQITVGNLVIDQTVVQTIQSGDGPGGNISINATTVGLTNSATVLSSTGLDFTTSTSGAGSGNGGNVTVQGLQPGGPADSVALSNGSGIQTLTFGLGKGGDVQLSARFLTMDNFSAIVTGTSRGGGVGGDVVLNVGTASLLGGALIQSQGENFIPGFGPAGNVTIQGLQGVGSAAESVTLSGRSGLLTQSFGSSDGGRVDIIAKSLTMDGAGTTINASANDVGRGGDIVLSLQQARLSDGAAIITQTNSVIGAPPGPIVTVQGLQGAGSRADAVVFSGSGSGIIADSLGAVRAGEIAVHAKTVTLKDGALIIAGTPVTTAAGSNVIIDADSVDISGGSRISSQSSLLDAGQVTITANALTLDKGSIATNTSGIGRGGDVVLNVGSISLSNGATINSSSLSPEPNAGDAGNVTITSSGPFTNNASTITTSAENASGGDIKVTAQSVALSNGAVMSASSASPQLPDGGGDAGNITIQSGSTVVMNNSVMAAEASQASGGQFTITAPEMVRLINSRISTSVFGGTGSGGNITIDPQFVILQNSQIIAGAFFGPGGAIDITAGVFLADPASIVEASSTLNIRSTVQNNIGEQLTPLSQQFSSADALLFAQQCAADPTGQFSSFVQTGRDGVPQVPGALSPSPLSFLEALTSSSLGSPVPNWAAARLGLDSVTLDDSTRFRFYSACRS